MSERPQKLAKKKPQVKTIPDMKVEFNKEIESPKKTQDEIKREVKNSGCWTKTLYESLNNRLKDMEDRVSHLEDKVEKWISWSKKVLNIKNKYPDIINPGNLGQYLNTIPMNNRYREGEKHTPKAQKVFSIKSWKKTHPL